MKRGAEGVWPTDEVEAAARSVLERPLTRREHAALRRYAELLRTWNRVHRLVGPATLAGIGRDLVIDSLLFRPLLPEGPVHILDLGTGAGVPGIPLAITTPQLTGVLVEARRKRISFLLAAGRELGLERVEIVHARAETLLGGRPALAGAFDVVVARCVARPTPLAEMAHPFMKPGGMLAISGPPAGAALAIPVVPWGEMELRHVVVPDLGIRRSFLVARNVLN